MFSVLMLFFNTVYFMVFLILLHETLVSLKRIIGLVSFTPSCLIAVLVRKLRKKIHQPIHQPICFAKNHHLPF